MDEHSQSRPFESVDDLLRTTRVIAWDGKEFATRLHIHGVVRVAEDGAYLIDLLSEYESPDASQSRLAPGLYRVVTLRPVAANTDGPYATCIFREDVAAVRWEWPPQRYLTDTTYMALITPAALALWVDLIEREQAASKRKDPNRLRMVDFPVWNGTCELCTSLDPPDPVWAGLGLRLNDSEGGDGVCIATGKGTYLHWGQDASGSRVAMMCGWEYLAGVPPSPGAGDE
jgi:hypothetical protein